MLDSLLQYTPMWMLNFNVDKAKIVVYKAEG